jgi:hypothetical protein
MGVALEGVVNVLSKNFMIKGVLQGKWENLVEDL